MVNPADHRVTRWGVTAIGVALVLSVTIDPIGSATVGASEIGLSAVLAVGVIAVGAALARSDVDTRVTYRAVAWTIGGCAAMTAAGAWTISMHPVTALAAKSIISFNLIAGALAGSLVGSMSALNRHRASMLAAERERLSFLNYLLRHNVLNGVQVVTGQTNALRDDVPADVERRVDVIESWTVGLGDLVSRMRQFLDARTGDRELEPIHVGGVIDTEVAKVAGAFDADITSTGSDPAVTADDGLHQVFECLLVDAVERSESAEPDIAVTTSQRGDDVLVEVSSPDPIASTDGGESFEPNTDGDPAGDLGFGRYLVATLVDYYGGTVDIGDRDDDVLYTIELPTASNP